MKKSDMLTIAVIALISVMVAYFVAGTLIGQPSQDTVTIKEANPIKSTVTDPDPDIFNKNAINPTVEVQIGENKESE